MKAIKKHIIKEYNNFINENNLEKSENSIELFESFMFYDIRDNIEELSNIYGLSKGLKNHEAQKRIENINKYILLDYIKTKYQRQKEKIREEAKGWQNSFFEKNSYYSDLITWQEYFEKYGKRYGLLKEFRENGIV